MYMEAVFCKMVSRSIVKDSEVVEKMKRIKVHIQEIWKQQQNSIS